MKKILFNDKFMLTQAVLDGSKTQSRRVITYPKTFHGEDVCGYYVCRRATDRAITEVCMYDENESFIDEGQILPKYKVGEVVAVAQSYKDIFSAFSQHPNPQLNIGVKNPTDTAGWNNKMFVKAELMPHQIRITDVRVERLQAISDEDCLKEGIQTSFYGDCKFPPDRYTFDNGKSHFNTPREAFAHLINKVSREDVWSENPYVFVYDFELVK